MKEAVASLSRFDQKMTFSSGLHCSAQYIYTLLGRYHVNQAFLISRKEIELLPVSFEPWMNNVLGSFF